jgi:hypothetical protein
VRTKKKYQNFGSSVSRDLLLHSPKRKKNNSIDNYIKYSFFADHSFEMKKIITIKEVLMKNQNFIKILIF